MKSPIIELIDIVAEKTAMNYSECNDTDLVKNLKRGDTEAFRHLILRYQSPLIRYLNAWLQNEAVAKDICQDVFMVLLENPPSAGYLKKSIQGWLFRIARNKAIDYIRRQTRSESLEAISEHEVILKVGSMKGDTYDIYSRDALYASLRELPDELRDVLQMRYFAGLSFREISQATDNSIGVINGKTRKALGMLRAGLEKLKKERS